MSNFGPKNAFSDELHALKYRQPGESFPDAMARLAKAMATDAAHEAALLDALDHMRFMPAGRIQASMGTNKAVTAMNCVVGSRIEDSLLEGENSIANNWREIATVLRMGAGLGNDYSTLRPEGAHIGSLDSQSSGPISFMGVTNAICETMRSAGHRRGALMGVLRVDHPDILKFVKAKQNKHALTNFNISVAVTDEFMRAVENDGDFNLRFNGKFYGTIRARDLWHEIMRSTWDWAEPGVLFIDTINRLNPLYYCEKIAAVNPCFSGETKVWTDQGHRTFLELAGKTVKVLTQRADGRLVYRAMHNIRKTQVSVSVLKLTFDNGTSVTCTPEHVFFLRDGRKVMAKDLTSSDRIASAYRYKANQKGYLRIIGAQSNLLEHHIPFEVDGLGKKLHVHHINGVKTDNRPDNLEVIDASEHNSMHLRGDNNPMRRYPERNNRLGGNKGKENPRYRTDIDTTELKVLKGKGLSNASIAQALGCSKSMVAKRLGWVRPELRENHRVIGIEYLSQPEDVYCGTVEETGKFFIACGEHDGVLVSNCGEQPLGPNNSCLLGSFNLAKYVDKPNNRLDPFKLSRDVYAAVEALDNVIDRAQYPTEIIRQEMLSKRRMGLGVTGVANALEALGSPYGSPAFVKHLEAILQLIQNEAWRASINLAKTRGSFPLFDADLYLAGEYIAEQMPLDIQEDVRKYGLRNSHLTSIAPTGTISMCADNVSSGIEPVFAHKTKRAIGTPQGPREVAFDDYGLASFGHKGRTTNDVTIAEHLAVLAVSAKYVDSAVSKTVNCPDTMTFEEFENVYMDAWKANIKGVATFRKNGKRMALLTDEVDEGAACTIDPETGAKSCG